MATAGAAAAAPMDGGEPELTGGPVGPVSSAERIAVLDVLRGFALLGILLVNMAVFAGTIYEFVMGGGEWSAPHDRAAEWAVAFFAQGKFYSLFSLLFGLGLTIQMERAAQRGASFVPLYVRRLLVLLGIGLLHAYLIWVGDILVTYALLGFVLLPFRNRRPKTLLIWAGILLLVPTLLTAAGAAALGAARSMPGAAAEMERALDDAAGQMRARSEEAALAYRTGSYGEVTAQRARDLTVTYPQLPVTMPSVLAMFLVGVWAGKRRIFQDADARRPFLRRALLWGLVLGTIGNLAFVLGSEAADPLALSGASALSALGQAVGAPAFCALYAAGITLLYGSPAWRPRLAVLAPVGRMALTNYLLQSVVCTIIFYGYGLGLSGRVGPAAGVLLSLAIWLLQIPLSHWWLRHFQFGPAEWLWRTLTYLRPQPFRAA